MLRFLADENFDNKIVRGLFRRHPAINIVRVQDVGLSGKDDPTVLEWAAQEGCILLTHDVATITRYAYDRVRQGQTMPGVIEISSSDTPIGQVIEDVLLLVECSQPEDLKSQILYLPW
jgi:predicted nuclease of predicted toxin-antitoxin system